jgi:LysM repeat protein
MAAEGPRACPFVALADDPEVRAGAPDPRHRCYAQDPPEPRSHGHQQTYCLTPNYPSCAYFQDWASRRQARLLGTPAVTAPASWRGPPGEDRSHLPLGQLAAFDAIDEGRRATRPTPPPDADRPTPPAIPVLPRSSAPAAPTDAGTSYATASRLLRTAAPPATDEEGDELEDEEAEAAERPRPGGRLASWLRRPEEEADEAEAVRVAPLRQARRGIFDTGPRTPQSNARPQMPWERARRRESYPNLSIAVGASGVSGILIALAVIAVMAAIVFMLPRFLPGPNRPAGQPTATARVQQTPAPAGATAAPNAPARTYTVARGDTVERIARRFNITVRELLAANPKITNPNRIRIGDKLTIPARR